jgi:alpha-L-fucosidase 2
MEWKEGKFQSLHVHSKLGNTLTSRYGEIVKSFETEKGEVLKFNEELVMPD